MNLDEFFQQIGTARWRAAQLHSRSRKSFVQQQELLLEGFEELYAALEDLQVAHEELRQQNEELAGAREVVEVERQGYQDLFEFMPDAYLVTDRKGIIREANRAATKLLNVQQQFLVGKPLVIFVSNEERRAFLSKLSGLLFAQNREQKWEVRLQQRNGEPIDATVKVATVHHREGKQIALGWLVRPIIERKQGDSALGLLTDAV